MNEGRTAISRAAAVAGVIVLLSACVASHSRARPDGAQLFTSADANNDGVVTRAEFLAARASNFAKYDRNGDGFIDTQDVPRRARAARKVDARLDELSAHFDANGDGRISRAEFVNGPAFAFDRADTNRDGQLSRDELEAASKAMQSRRGGAN